MKLLNNNSKIGDFKEWTINNKEVCTVEVEEMQTCKTLKNCHIKGKTEEQEVEITNSNWMILNWQSENNK